jgi:hypothetical protein
MSEYMICEIILLNFTLKRVLISLPQIRVNDLELYVADKGQGLETIQLVHGKLPSGLWWEHSFQHLRNARTQVFCFTAFVY